jgi:hypothetical protein
MKEPQLIVTFSDQSQWEIPAKHIAHERAKYYAGPRDTETYNQEYDLAMKDQSEILDWAKNNINWSDVRRFARQIKFAQLAPYEDEWCNAEMKVI